ncbi:ABC transporter ATP-binding protein [Leptospira interrogans]
MKLETRKLSYGYRNLIVGRDLDFHVAAGEVVALLGPNGGGKTTLLKTLLGLLSPLAGEILIDDRPLQMLSTRERAQLVAYVPQVHAGTFAFAVEDIVLMGRSAHGNVFTPPSQRDREAAHHALERLELLHLSQRPYTMISGGERQLVLIARALAQQPRFVVLDEPTANLDFGNQGKVMREIRALAASGLGVIFSTHDPNHALRHADHALLIRDGTCLAAGAVESVLTQTNLIALYASPVLSVGEGRQTVFLSG